MALANDLLITFCGLALLVLANYHGPMKSTRQQLLDDIDAFRAEFDIAESTFGLICLNDKGFVTRLRREGRGVSSDTIDKVRAFIRDYRPPKKNPKRAAAQAAA